MKLETYALNSDPHATSLTEITTVELEQAAGGIAPLVAFGIGLACGVAFGMGVEEGMEEAERDKNKD